MESFYGGKPSFSFIIVKNFESVDAMVEAFQQGPSYTTVHYDEHVLINTENKNDNTNGQIYRRGYDYTNDLGGAVYIGTIVGPAGPAPMLELTTVAEVKAIVEEEGFEYRYSEGEYAPTENLVPGYDSETGEYNDSIQWACYCVRDENGEDATAYIGFIFPYLVEDFTAESVSPYYNRSTEDEDFVNQDLIERTDDTTHPYYEAWHISVPKGIHGESINNFRVITAEMDDGVEGDGYEGTSAQEDDQSYNRQILVYDYYNYDAEESPDPITIYLGDYNMIEDIVMDSEGTVTISYTHDNDDIYSNLFKWIDSISLDTETGLFTVVYNYGADDENSTTYTTYLSWVKGINIAEDGTITYNYSYGDDSLNTTATLQWIDSVSMSADGYITLIYNTLDDDGNNNIEQLEEQIQWIESIVVADNGTLTITYNTLDDDGNNNTTVYNNLIKVITNIEIETIAEGETELGTGDQKVHITYNTGEEDIIGEPLNYILEMAITSAVDNKTYQLLVYYSDPEIRNAAIEAGESFTYDGKDGWINLGTVKDEDGILTGLNLTSSDIEEAEVDISDISAIVAYLNELYPDGLEGDNLTGKIITIGDSEDNKTFYAFDYTLDSDGNYKGWYYLGTLSLDLSNLFLFESSDSSTLSANQSNLSAYGLWFELAGEENSDE